MRVLLAAAFVVALSTVGLAADAKPADQKTSGSAPSDLSFLEVGKQYYIQFPKEDHPFAKHESEIVQTSQNKPATWTMDYWVKVFKVKQLGGGSWVLLEHAVDPKDAFVRESARHSLTDEKIAELKATEEGLRTLARLQERVNEKIEMTATWVNLDYALTISEPPAILTGAPEWKVNARIDSQD